MSGDKSPSITSCSVWVARTISKRSSSYSSLLSKCLLSYPYYAYLEKRNTAMSKLFLLSHPAHSGLDIQPYIENVFTHLAPYIVITIGLTIFPMLYFISP